MAEKPNQKTLTPEDLAQLNSYPEGVTREDLQQYLDALNQQGDAQTASDRAGRKDHPGIGNHQQGGRE